MQALPQFVAISFFPEAEPGLYQPHVCFFIHQNRKRSVEQWGFICKAERQNGLYKEHLLWGEIV